MKRSAVVRIAVTVVFLTVIAFGLKREFPACVRAMRGERGISVRKRIDVIRETCLRKIPRRMELIGLNGWVVRMIGQHFCNDVVRMEGDFLAQPDVKRVSMGDAACNMRRFADFCASNGVMFAYVQLPKKLDAGQSMLPPGYVDAAYANVDDLLADLKKLEVPFADWRQGFSATPADVWKNFYRTDHHWNTDAAFRATGLLAAEICTRCRIEPLMAADVRRVLSSERWERTIMPQIFMGSLARRTGLGFAGCDDVVMMTPKFETELMFEVPDRHVKVTGSFRQTLMRRIDELEKVDDPFDFDIYSLLYVGGIYPCSRSVNARALLDLKILLIGDSYARPVSAFAATVVRELILIDPRRRNPEDPSLVELIRREKPDVVIQMQSPSSLSSDRMTGRKTGRKIMFEYGF